MDLEQEHEKVSAAFFDTLLLVSRMTKAAESMALKRRRWLQFSLRTLLFLMVVAAVAFSWRTAARQRQEIQHLRSEVNRLKDEVGEIVIAEGDENKLHVKEIPAIEPLIWKWRIYVPPERAAQLRWTAGSIPQTGYDLGPFPIIETSILYGEPVLTVALRRNEDSQWVLIVQEGFRKQSLAVSSRFSKMLDEGNSTEFYHEEETLIIENRKGRQLLRFRMVPRGNNRTAREEGVLVWIHDVNSDSESL